jgi:type I restriction enzyme M protein
MSQLTLSGSQQTLPFTDFNQSRVVLKRIRNFLAGQVTGSTRDEALLDEVLKCAYCRIHLERAGLSNTITDILNDDAIIEQYCGAFAEIKKKFPHLFNENETINLHASELAVIDREFATLHLATHTHDIIGDIYETFIGSAYRGQEGQFFTPNVAVSALVEMIEPDAKDFIIDPACGTGSFLLEAARYIGTNGDVLPQRIHGVDKDSDLARLSQLHLAIQYDSLFPINCADSLLWRGNGFDTSETKQLLGQFSIVLTNPPFGSKIVSLSGEARKNFELAYMWKFSKKENVYERINEFSLNTPPQVLFVERCLSLLKDGGKLGIVLPESILSNTNYRYVVQYILQNAIPIAVIGMPESLFKTSGKGGTHTKVCLVILKKGIAQKDHKVFMAEAKWCGHDSRGREIPKNDIPEILRLFKSFIDDRKFKQSTLGYAVPLNTIRGYVLAPRFYNPEPMLAVDQLKDTHTLYRLGDLVKSGCIKLATGDEIGKLFYGTGEIPFVRTSDISNWEIKVDPKHGVSKDIFNKYGPKQDVREGDILFVRDGTYLIGSCAFISRFVRIPMKSATDSD